LVSALYRFDFWFSLLMSQRPLGATLFPYTTLFRSSRRISRTCARTRTGRTSSGRSIRRSRRTAISRFFTATSRRRARSRRSRARSEEHTSELQSRENLVCRLLLEKKKDKIKKVLFS